MEEDATNAPKDMARDKTPLTFRVLFTITKGDRGASELPQESTGFGGGQVIRQTNEVWAKKRGKGEEKAKKGKEGKL